MANVGLVELRIANYIKSYVLLSYSYANKILKIPRISLLRKNKKFRRFELPSLGLKSDLVIPRSENKVVVTYSSKLNLASRVIFNR